MSDSMNDRRRAALADVVGGADVYSDRTADALDGGHVPRYALTTAEDAYRDNPNITVWDDLDELAAAASGELNEEYAWVPQRIVDLSTGDEFSWELRVTVHAP